MLQEINQPQKEDTINPWKELIGGACASTTHHSQVALRLPYVTFRQI